MIPRLTCSEQQLNAVRTEWLRNGGYRGTGKRLGEVVWERYGRAGTDFNSLFYERNAMHALWLAFCEINGVEP